jgi:hypothetical protein
MAMNYGPINEENSAMMRETVKIVLILSSVLGLLAGCEKTRTKNPALP